LNSEGGGGVLDENAQMQRAKEALLKQQLKHSLKALPAPKNEYEINFAGALPEGKVEEKEDTAHYEEDAEDAARRIAREQKAREDADKRRQSQVIQRALPRPLQVNTAYGKGGEVPAKGKGALEVEAARLVQQELVAMLQADALTHKLPGVDAPAGAKALPVVGDSFMDQARSLIAQELKSLHQIAPPNVAKVTDAVAAVHSSLTYVPASRQYLPKASLSPEQIISSLKYEHEVGMAHASREAKKVGKLEAKVAKFTAGYQKRSEVLVKEGEQLLEKVQEQNVALATYQLLLQYELDAIPKRLDALTSLVDAEKKREGELQARYQALMSARQAKSNAPAPKVM